MHSGNLRPCLVVEDVRAMRLYLRTMLEGTFCVTEAGSLREARQALRANSASPPHIIVLDLDLPDGNGLDLLPEISLASRIVALTADITREVELLCRGAGCDLVIEKNSELSSLRELIGEGTPSGRRAAGRSAGEREAYAVFLAEALVDLEDAKRSADILTIRRIAHRLRGTAVHFGFPGIGAAARSVNQALGKGELDQVDAATNSLSGRIGDVLEAHYLNTRKANNLEVDQCDFS